MTSNMPPESVELLKTNLIKNTIIYDDEKCGEKQEFNYDDLVQRITKDLQKKKQFANPALVGLTGFALSNALMQFHNLNWLYETNGTSPVVIWCGIVFGGFAQLVAGFMEFGTGNNFGFCAFSTYGAFWIAKTCIAIWSRLVSKVSEEDFAIFLFVFAVFTLIMLIGSSRENLSLFLVFLLVFIGLCLLVIAHFWHEYDKSNGYPIKKTAAVILLLDAIVPLYIVAHILYLDLFKRDFLPLGPPLNELFFKRATTKITLNEVA